MSEVRPPKTYRLADRGLIAGVSAGLSLQLRLPVWAVRAVFVAAAGWKFSGAVAYALLWLFLAPEPKDEPIGLVVAQRDGLRPPGPRFRWPRLVAWLVCAALGFGLAWLIWWYDRSWIGRNALDLYWLGVGVALVWLVRDVAWRWGLRLAIVIVGVMVAWVAAAAIVAPAIASQRWLPDPELNAFLTTALVMAATVAVCLASAAAWIVHPAPGMASQRAELIASTRAEMAAHLHDSVLQTLAVLQKQPNDAGAVAQLARAQEKELRQYLYGDRLDETSLKAALNEIVAEVEATYPLLVEMVFVGQARLTPELDALVAATREALVNAAKHSGADRVDVFVEVSSGRVQVFVRDRGRGFAIADIGDDRLGLRRSIIERMARFGGRAHIRSTPGEGTEIELDMPYGEDRAD